ncbi:MAG: hypothetical protein Q9157_006748 [Trypethelium eluteriae]
MNCASVTITGSPSSRRRERQSSSASSMNDLPNIWVANLPEVNKCTTSEGVDPVYPDPGPEVEYGAGLSKSSPPSPKNCEDSSPGPAYKNVEGSNGGSGSSSAASSANSGATSSAAPIASSSPNASGMIGLSSASAAPVATSTAPYSVVPVDGGPTATSNPGGVFVPEITSAASAATSDASTSTSNFRISHTTITMTISETTTVTTTHHPSTSSSQSSTAPLQITSTTLGSYSANRVASVSTEPGLYSSTSPTYPVVVKPLPTPTVASNLDCPIPAAFPLTLTSASDLYVPIPLSRAPIFTPTTAPLNTSTPPSNPPQSPLNRVQPPTIILLPSPTNHATSTGASTAETSPPATSSSPLTSSTPASPSSTPPYATSANGDYSAYLPCNPGAFLCTSATTFLTCDIAPSNSSGSSPSSSSSTSSDSDSGSAAASYIWTASRVVAAGMECQPSLSAASSGSSSSSSVGGDAGGGGGSGAIEQQASSGTSAVPSGFVRDDQYVASSNP